MATMEDEYWGQGGTYLLDSKTGKRKLIERTEPAKPLNPEPEELSDGSADTQAPNLGQNGND
jgi:hypothetical protein